MQKFGHDEEGVRQGTEDRQLNGYAEWQAGLTEQIPGGLPAAITEALREMSDNGMGSVVREGFLRGAAEGLNPPEA